MGKLYISEVLRIAESQIGYKEKATNQQLDSFEANAGSNNWNKYARDLWAVSPHYYNGPKNGYSWCTAFVDWCILEACGRDSAKAQAAVYYTGPYGGSCTYSTRYYKAAGKWYTKNPKPGDQIFFGTSADNVQHTGLVVKVENGTVYTIEGNSNNQVRRRSYVLGASNIFGYGRPAYDGDAPPPEEPVPEPVNEYPTHFNDVRGDAFYAKAVVWAVEHQLVAGTSDTTFSPEQSLTRGEFVTILKRFAEEFGLT